jgi:hypothetical protein
MCPECTFYNPKARPKCEMCDAYPLRPGENIRKDVPKHTFAAPGELARDFYALGASDRTWTAASWSLVCSVDCVVCTSDKCLPRGADVHPPVVFPARGVRDLVHPSTTVFVGARFVRPCLRGLSPPPPRVTHRFLPCFRWSCPPAGSLFAPSAGPEEHVGAAAPAPTPAPAPVPRHERLERLMAALQARLDDGSLPEGSAARADMVARLASARDQHLEALTAWATDGSG